MVHVLVAPPNPEFSRSLAVEEFDNFFQFRLPKLEVRHLDRLKQVLPEIESFAIIGNGTQGYPSFGDLNPQMEQRWEGLEILHQRVRLGTVSQPKHLMITCVDPRLNAMVAESDKLVIRTPGGEVTQEDLLGLKGIESITCFGHNDCAAEQEFLPVCQQNCSYFLHVAGQTIFPKLFPDAQVSIEVKRVTPRKMNT